MVNQVAKKYLKGCQAEYNEWYRDNPAEIKYVGYRDIFVVRLRPEGFGKECYVKVEADYKTLVNLALSKGHKVGGFGYAKGYEPKEWSYEQAMASVGFTGSVDDFCWLCVMEHYFNASPGLLGKLVLSKRKGWRKLCFKETVANKRK